VTWSTHSASVPPSSGRGTASRRLRAMFAPAAIVVTTLLVLDTAVYFALPSRLAARLPGYRVPFHDVLTGGQGKYPQHYFVRHPERGFDMGPGRRGTHFVEGQTYPIWSNALGCFDKEWSPLPTDYYYFAGDSMTWGYAPYETKFATVFEALTGIPSVKCGVTHTGQLHQLAKFREVTAKIGALPKKVFVGYFFNDTANDYAYPHATVVDGWLIDNAYVDPDLNLVRVDDEWLARRVDLYLAARRRESRLAKMLLAYSVTAQAVSSVYAGVARALEPPPRAGAIFERGRGPNGVMLSDISWVSERQKSSGYLEYETFRFAERNKDAIKRWKADSIARGYELVFILFERREFYAELLRFLDDNQVVYIELAEEFRKRRIGDDRLYWPIDGHFSPNGNRLAGEVLSELEGASRPRR
jgi:hypothetical protein